MDWRIIDKSLQGTLTDAEKSQFGYMHKPNLGISEKEVANRAKLGIISTKDSRKG